MDAMNWKKESDRKEFPLFEDGTYLVSIDSWVKGESKKSKSPQIEWTMTMCEDGNPLGGQEFKDFMSLSSAALWRVAGLIKAAGVDMENLPEMVVGSEEFNRVLDLVKGRKVYVELVTEVYDSKPRNKVKAYIEYSEQEPAPAYGDNKVPDFIKNKVKKAGLV